MNKTPVTGHARVGDARAFARRLRRKQTTAEAWAWDILRDRRVLGLKFRRQQPIAGFVVDFACMDPRVIIELDGAVHIGREQADEERSQVLRSHGFRVIRIANEELSLEVLTARIRALLDAQ